MQYGKNNWKHPLKKKYFNHDSIKYNRDWTNKEWPFIIRRYNILTHKLDVNKTLAVINASLNNSSFLVTLPPDNINYEN